MLEGAGVRRLTRSAARVARTRYPSFLFGSDLRPGEVPVFCYHDVDPETLAGDLQFLARNGYRTLGLDEFHERSTGRRARGERCVLLTFDDARRSFWDVALPVLRAHEARAALFVPTYWPGEPDGTERQEAASTRFMSWAQLECCERDELIDVESHAHRHVLVATSARLAGFASPATLARYDLFDWPMRREGGGDVLGRPPLGTPVYESAPLLSASERFIEPPEAAAACCALVEAGGGAAFFERRGAAAELAAAHRSAARRTPGRTIGAAELADAELELAVETFRARLGRPPRYFAYPWSLGTHRSLQRLADLGFRAAFGVALDFRRARSRRLPLPVHGRFKCDWLRFLPGEGRRRLRDVVPQKLAGFTDSQHLAH